MLAHFYRRSAWQSISKSLLGFLKVLAAGEEEVAKRRNFHYKGTFETIRDSPERLLDNPSFTSPTYGWLDVVKDPIPYIGGPLRYTQLVDPRLKMIRVLTAYAEQLSKHHGWLIDTNEGVRRQIAHSASILNHLF
jgi:hypothetical protein